MDLSTRSIRCWNFGYWTYLCYVFRCDNFAFKVFLQFFQFHHCGHVEFRNWKIRFTRSALYLYSVLFCERSHIFDIKSIKCYHINQIKFLGKLLYHLIICSRTSIISIAHYRQMFFMIEAGHHSFINMGVSTFFLFKRMFIYLHWQGYFKELIHLTVKGFIHFLNILRKLFQVK